MAENNYKDMFLRVETARQGIIKGESRDDSHFEEIDVLAWSWGMHTDASMSSAAAGSKATAKLLHVEKAVDSASTALMSAMRNNETIKKAQLTIRKAGKGQLDYLKVTLENGRITAFDVGSGDPTSALINEKLSFSFHKIIVEYIPQGEDGLPRGGMLFVTETALS